MEYHFSFFCTHLGLPSTADCCIGLDIQDLGPGRSWSCTVYQQTAITAEGVME